MGAVTLFARAITATNIQLARIMNWAVLLLFLLLLTDVIMRKVAGAPISWSHQASKLLFGVYAIIGGGYLWRAVSMSTSTCFTALSRRAVERWWISPPRFCFFFSCSPYCPRASTWRSNRFA